MSLPDLLVSFLLAALASLVFCVLKIAFDAAAAAPGSASWFHRPAGASAVPNGLLECGAAEKKGVKRVSFEGDAEGRRDRRQGLSVDGYEGMTVTRESWSGVRRDGLVQRGAAGRKLSVVTEE